MLRIIVFSLILSISAFAQTKINLQTQVKGVLPVTNGGTGTAGTPGVAGAIGFGQGTSTTPAPGQVQITAPTNVTAYQFVLPGASGSGILVDTASASVDTITRVSTTGNGNVVLASGPALANATCTGTCTGFGGSTVTASTLFIHGTCNGAVASANTGNGGVAIDLLGGNVGNGSCNNNAGIDRSGGTVLTHTCVLQKLFVNSKTSGGGAGDGVFTVQDGATGTTVTCTMNATSACNDTTHTFSALAGDLIWVTGLTTSPNLSNISASLECD